MNSSKHAVESQEKCIAKLIESRIVKVKLRDGRELYSYHVETFSLDNHATAKRAYAWETFGNTDPHNLEYTVVLGEKGINSAEDALAQVFKGVLDALNSN